jgi:hypothetical protein
MKRLLIFLFTLSAFSVSAQVGTDLGFSQAINEQVQDNSTLGPVPSGKIWKLVGFSTQFVANSSYLQLRVNGSNATILRYLSTTGPHSAQLPIYFNESDMLEFLLSGGNEAYVSIIEYTVIP